MIRVTANPGETFLDRMIALVEGAKRQRTPNEIALSILLSGLTLVFLLATVTLRPFGSYRRGRTVPIVALVALLVCLIPTTIGGLLSAIGIAGMDRVARFNVLAMSGRAVEASGDVDVILLDKTGTITFGNRLASAIVPAPGVAEGEVARGRAGGVAARRDAGGPVHRGPGAASARGAGPRGRRRRRRRAPALDARIAEQRDFSAETRTSGVVLADGTTILKGAVDAIGAGRARRACRAGALGGDAGRSPAAAPRPWRCSRDGGCSALIELKDTVKPGLAERFAEFRRMGIRTVMITGDNPLTAATIAAEAGVDDFVAEAKPEDKIALHPRPAGGGPPRGHDRRRHQRCPGARPGRRRPGDEQRHLRDQGGRQHGRPRLRPHEAARGHRDRQAAAHHPRLHHDLLDRERRGEVLRDPAGAVRRRLPGAGGAQRHGPRDARRARSCRRSSSTRWSSWRSSRWPCAAWPSGPRRPPSLLRRNLLVYGLGGIIAPFIGIKLIDVAITALGLA